MEEQNSQTEDITSTRINNILIAVLLVVVIFLAYNFFQSTSGENTDVTAPDSMEQVLTDSTEPTVTGTKSDTSKETSMSDSAENGYQYTVKAGDTLWKIAERELENGFLWKEIASVNHIDQTKATNLEVGDVITIPQVASAQTTVPNVPESVGTTQTDTVAVVADQIYVVKHGDTLWKIAEQYYGDGAMWHKVFEYSGNHLSMYTAKDGHQYPIIHAGNVLMIPAVPVTPA